MMSEIITAKGHENVTARHRTTLEITKESELTLKGDCIVAVCADRSLNDLTQDFKDSLRDDSTTLQITLSCGGLEDRITARGHPDLIHTHPTDMVVRKSGFICPRTLAIKADKAASDLNRELIEKLKQKKNVTIHLEIFSP